MENDFEEEPVDIEGIEKDAELDFEPEFADEEEREKLLDQIKNEIRMKVRKELQSDKLIAQLEDPVSKIAEFELLPENAIDTGDLSNISDEKLRDAIIKMRKYDAILSVKTENEREVKRSRLLERQRIRREMLAILSRNGGNVKTNIDQFFGADTRVLRKYYSGVRIPNGNELEANANAPQAIAFEYRDELTRIEAEEQRTLNGGVDRETDNATPFFKTQLDDFPDKETDRSKTNGKSGQQSTSQRSDAPSTSENGASKRQPKAGEDGVTKDRPSRQNAAGRESQVSSTATTSSNKAAKGNRDFVRRNIELAGRANDTIALTGDERERLDRLLADMTAFGDDSLTYNESASSSQRSRPSDAFTVADSEPAARFSLLPASAFSGEIDEVERLREIETRLNVYQDEVSSSLGVDSNRSRLETASNSNKPASVAAPSRLSVASTKSRAPAGSKKAPSPAIAESSPNPNDTSSMTNMSSANETEVDTDRLGEATLQELKEERERKSALAAIDKAIGDFRAPRLIQARPLSRADIDALVHESMRALSHCRTGSAASDQQSLGTVSNRSALSSRATKPNASANDREALIELRKSADLSSRASASPSSIASSTVTGRELAVPIDSETLQRLLDEAKREGVMYVPQSLIGTIDEDPNEDADSVTTGTGSRDGNGSGPGKENAERNLALAVLGISDETWRRISEEQPDPTVYGDYTYDASRLLLHSNASNRLATPSDASTRRSTVVEIERSVNANFNGTGTAPALPNINLTGNMVTQPISARESRLSSQSLSHRERLDNVSLPSTRGRPTSSD